MGLQDSASTYTGEAAARGGERMEGVVALDGGGPWE